MPVQTSYPAVPGIGYEGQLADCDFTSVLSRLAAVALGAGRCVTRAADGTCKLPTVAADITGGGVLGISIYDASKIPGVYGVNDMVPVLHKGRIYVVPEEGVNEGDPVFVRFAVGAGGANLGAFRKSADTATAAQLPSAVYRLTASASGLAVVEINLP